MTKTLIAQKGRCKNRYNDIFRYVNFYPKMLKDHKFFEYAVNNGTDTKLFTHSEFVSTFEILGQMRVKQNGK